MLKNKASEKKRFGIFNILMLIFNIASLAALILSYLSSHISPERSWLLPFFGLFYPFLLLVNLFFMVYWILRKRWIFLVSALVIIIGWNHVQRTYQIRFTREVSSFDHSFKVVSYNVKNLSNDNVDLVEPEVRNQIIGFLDSQNSDIICLQEFAVVHPEPGAFIDSLSLLLNMPYHAYSLYLTKPRRLMDGVFIFSKFPIIYEEPINNDNTHNYGLLADLLIGPDTVRVFNVHLESIRLKHEDYNFISEFDLQFEKDEKIKERSYRIIKKLRTAFHRRAAQVENLAEFIKKSPNPVILCGDFNDTPNSYTYQKLTALLNDAFMKSGTGFGNTYIGKLPSYRIDYILYDNNFTSMEYQRAPIKLSDHYPISCRMKLR
jgi:endonuclease/exonuclease/phosphatase family metal-dependent hydrolase